MISADLLRRIRNDLPMPVTIAALGREGPPCKISEGHYRSVCPPRAESRATANPPTTPPHFFSCQKTPNNTPLPIPPDYAFPPPAPPLHRCLNRSQPQQPKKKTPPPP